MNAVAGELVARGWRVGYAVLDDGVNTALPMLGDRGTKPCRVLTAVGYDSEFSVHSRVSLEPLNRHVLQKREDRRQILSLASLKNPSTEREATFVK